MGASCQGKKDVCVCGKAGASYCDNAPLNTEVYMNLVSTMGVCRMDTTANICFVTGTPADIHLVSTSHSAYVENRPRVQPKGSKGSQQMCASFSKRPHHPHGIVAQFHCSSCCGEPLRKIQHAMSKLPMRQVMGEAPLAKSCWRLGLAQCGCQALRIKPDGFC